MYNNLFSTIVIPGIDIIYKTSISSLLREFNTVQYYPYSQLKERQEKRLKALLSHAYENVPLYREKFIQTGIRPDEIRTIEDLWKLPLTTKEQIRKSWPDGISATNIPDYRRIKNRTSGSTGTPLDFYTDKTSWQYRFASFSFFDQWAGVRTGDKYVHIGAPSNISLISRLYNKLQRKKSISVFELKQQNVDVILKQLARMKPKAIEGYSSSVSYLAARAKTLGMQIPTQAVICSSDTLQSKSLLEEVFNCTVFNRYGNREISGALVQNCNHDEGLHVNTEMVVLEIVDEQGKPAGTGKILLTDLTNFAAPFIRYDTGDIGTWSTKNQCSCGRGFPLIETIDGRTSELLHTSDGVISSANLGHFMFVVNDWLQYIVKYQAIQESRNNVIFKVVPTEALDTNSVNEMHRILQELLGQNITVKIDLVDDIPLEKTGKQKIIVSKI